ncbi:MAG: hypothetical protein ACI4VN_02160 [Clostridia bacterium]
MYNEKSFKITILFTKIRRYVFIFFFVVLALVGAYVVSEVLTEIFEFPRNISNILMVATGVCVFLLGFILTSNLNFKIQEAYLEMKTLKKINLVSYKLDKLLEQAGISISDELTRDLDETNKSLLTQKLKKYKKE